jgi:hypothetical protein
MALSKKRAKSTYQRPLSDLPYVKFPLYCEECAFLRLRVYTFTYSNGMGRDGDRGYLPHHSTPHVRYSICHIPNFLIKFLIPFTYCLSHVSLTITVLTIIETIAVPLSEPLSEVVIYNVNALFYMFMFELFD